MGHSLPTKLYIDPWCFLKGFKKFWAQRVYWNTWSFEYRGDKGGSADMRHCWPYLVHRENSPVIQTTPKPTLLTWGGRPRKNILHPHPWPRSQTRSYRAYHATQAPLFSRLLMLPLDTEVCCESQICLRFHGIFRNVILEMTFSAHCTSIWKSNPIPRSVISKVVQKCIWCCGRVQRCVTASHWARRWGKIVLWCMKAWSR